jgi:hypothetical protein
VHLRLGLGQKLEHRQRVVGDGRRDPALPEQPANLAQAAMAVIGLPHGRGASWIPRFPACVRVVVTVLVIAAVIMIMIVMVVVVMAVDMVVVGMAVVVMMTVPMTMIVIVIAVMVKSIVAVIMIVVVVMLPPVIVGVVVMTPPMVMIVVVMMMVMIPLVIVMVAIVIVMAVLVGAVVMTFLRGVHRASAGRIEHVELGGGDAAAGHLSRAELDALHPQSSDVTADHVQVRAQIEERAHEHVAAHACGRVEVQDARHLELSLCPRAASLLIMLAW